VAEAPTAILLLTTVLTNFKGNGMDKVATQMPLSECNNRTEKEI